MYAARRFVGTNLNRLFANLPPPSPEDGPADGPGRPSEHARAAALARAIQGATAYLDLHSTSADTPPFAFQQPGCAVAARFAASFPVAYTIDDPTIIGKVCVWEALSLAYETAEQDACRPSQCVSFEGIGHGSVRPDGTACVKGSRCRLH